MANPKTDQQAKHDFIETVEETRAGQKDEIERRIQADEATLTADNGMDPSREEERWGRKLAGAEVRRRIQKLNPNLVFEVSLRSPSQTGIYELRSFVDPFTKAVTVEKFYVAGMMTEMCPEFSILVAEEEIYPDPDNPTTIRVRRMDHEIRGWRTTLAQLIRNKLITESDVEKMFEIAAGKSSERWQRQLHPAIEVNHGQSE